MGFSAVFVALSRGPAAALPAPGAPWRRRRVPAGARRRSGRRSGRSGRSRPRGHGWVTGRGQEGTAGPGRRICSVPFGSQSLLYCLSLVFNWFPERSYRFEYKPSVLSCPVIPIMFYMLLYISLRLPLLSSSDNELLAKGQCAGFFIFLKLFFIL